MNDFSSNKDLTDKLIQFADDTSIICCGQESSLHGKAREILQKKEDYVEMNKLTLNTNKNEFIFSRNTSDFGFVIQKQSSHNTKKLKISWYCN